MSNRLRGRFPNRTVSNRLPSWVLTAGGVAASLDIDFVNDQAYNSGSTSIASLLSCTRASSGYYTNADGTLTSFPANTLRYGDNGLLVEEQKTNLCTYSQDISQSVWGHPGGTITKSVNQSAAPDGTNTAGKITTTAGTNFFYMKNSPITVANGSVYTMTIYLKYINNTWAFIPYPSDASLTYVNLQTGAFGNIGGSVTSYSSDVLANGWIRFRLTATYASTSGQVGVGFASGNGGGSITAAGTEQIYVWGGQLELGARETSYIATTTTSAARNSDLVTCVSLASSYAGTPITQYVSGKYIASASPSTNDQALSGFEGTTSLYMDRFSNSSNIAVRGDGMNVDTGKSISSSAFKIGFAADVSDVAVVLNGGAAYTTNTLTSLPAGVTTFHLGSRGSDSNHMSGYITRFAYWPSRVSNANLQTLTT